MGFERMTPDLSLRARKGGGDTSKFTTHVVLGWNLWSTIQYSDQGERTSSILDLDLLLGMNPYGCHGTLSKAN